MEDVQARLSGPNTCVCCCEWIIGSKHISLILMSLVEYTVEAGETAPLSVRLRSAVPSLSGLYMSIGRCMEKEILLPLIKLSIVLTGIEFSH